MRFKFDWASLIFGKKLTVFALFFFVFEGNFQRQAPVGVDYEQSLFFLPLARACTGRKRETARSLQWELIFGGAIERRVFCVTSLGGLYKEGLFSEFYCIEFFRSSLVPGERVLNKGLYGEVPPRGTGPYPFLII